jgi:hypothetical protein
VSWWQISLIILGAIMVGLVVGYLLNYLIVTITARLRKRPANKPQAAAVIREPPKTMESPKTTESPKITEPPKITVADLFGEIENNRHIASQTRSGNLQPFQTKVWDTKRDEVHLLPAELREELTQAYFDMSLANSIVWLATEMGRRSSSLDESYLKLCASIADRLNRLKSPLEQLRLPQN